MTSAGVTVVADGTPDADERLSHALTNDTSLGIMRYADAGYDASREEAASKNIGWIDLSQET
jgi:urocanate hydratase